VDLAQRLAESLRALRQTHGLTQEQMARRLGVSRPTLTRLESGSQNTTLETLARLCRALRCEPGDLFRIDAVRLRRPRAIRMGREPRR